MPMRTSSASSPISSESFSTLSFLAGIRCSNATPSILSQCPCPCHRHRLATREVRVPSTRVTTRTELVPTVRPRLRLLRLILRSLSTEYVHTGSAPPQASGSSSASGLIARTLPVVAYACKAVPPVLRAHVSRLKDNGCDGYQVSISITGVRNPRIGMYIGPHRSIRRNRPRGTGWRLSTCARNARKCSCVESQFVAMHDAWTLEPNSGLPGSVSLGVLYWCRESPSQPEVRMSASVGTEC